jgi:hypothetical protein
VSFSFFKKMASIPVSSVVLFPAFARRAPLCGQVQAASLAEAAKACRALRDRADQELDVRDNKKFQADLGARLAAARGAAEKQQRASAAAARVELARGGKLQRAEQAAHERAVKEWAQRRVRESPFSLG